MRESPITRRLPEGMLILLILCGAVSAIVCALLLRYARTNGHRYSLTMPQRFHAGHVPRLGGVAMMVACTVGWAWIVIAEPLLRVPNQIRLSPAMGLAPEKRPFIELNARLSKQWPVAVNRGPLPDADAWALVADKAKYLDAA